MNFLLYTLILLSFGNINHDVQVAFFKITQNSKAIEISMTFEKEDLQQVFKKQEEFQTENQSSYLDQHFSVQINGENQRILYQVQKVKAKHIKIKGIIHWTGTVKNIQINNTCLLDIPSHSNVIELRLNKQERDFHMNKDRKSIDVSF